MIRFDNVGLSYDDGPEILRDISFSLDTGSFHFLTGQSGAGKSSLLRLMYLGLRPTRGRVILLGRETSTLPRAALPGLRRQIGVVFQSFRLLDHLSALDNVALPLRMDGVGEAQVREQVIELLHWVGLGEFIDARPATLSGGQQQRIAIARAVINRPRLLLADEPTGDVDDAIGMRLLYLFEELNKLGATVVIATHNERMIDRFGYPRLQLDDGRLSVLPPRQARGG